MAEMNNLAKPQETLIVDLDKTLKKKIYHRFCNCFPFVSFQSIVSKQTLVIDPNLIQINIAKGPKIHTWIMIQN